jgi:hypothetical protein
MNIVDAPVYRLYPSANSFRTFWLVCLEISGELLHILNLGRSDEYNKTFDGFMRRAGSDLIVLAINWRWGARLTDVENGFRAIRADVLPRLKLQADDLDIEQEMVIKSLKRGFRIMEVPSHEYVRGWGESKLSTWKGWKFLWGLLKEMSTRS